MSVTSEKQTMTVRWNRFDLVGMCAGAEPGSERLRGSIMQGSEAKKKKLFFRAAWKSPGEFQQVWNVLQECPLVVLPGMATTGVKVEGLGASGEAEGFPPRWKASDWHDSGHRQK